MAWIFFGCHFVRNDARKNLHLGANFALSGCGTGGYGDAVKLTEWHFGQKWDVAPGKMSFFLSCCFLTSYETRLVKKRFTFIADYVIFRACSLTIKPVSLAHARAVIGPRMAGGIGSA